MNGDPRWGNTHRDRKADAIFATVAALRPDVARGDWLDVGDRAARVLAICAPHCPTVPQPMTPPGP